MLRRTKIVATLGPATDDDAVLAAMIANGLDVARLNFSHGGSDVLAKRCEQLRRLADAAQRQVAILGDLQGPKIRISRFVGGSADLPVGSAFFLDPELADDVGNSDGVSIAYPQLASDVSIGDTLLLNDGQIALEVTGIDGSRVHT
ncbi:MAG: pyruvate kinase, partial [Pseudomonadota bacterium]